MTLVILLAGIGVFSGKLLAQRKSFPEWINQKFQKNLWQARIALFLVNAALIMFVVLFALLSRGLFASAPVFNFYVTLVLSFCAPAASIYFWLACKYAIKGQFRERLLVFLVGHSIYAALFGYFIYRFISMQPAYEGQDLMMKAVGFILAMLICAGAFVSGFLSLCSSVPKEIR